MKISLEKSLAGLIFMDLHIVITGQSWETPLPKNVEHLEE